MAEVDFDNLSDEEILAIDPNTMEVDLSGSNTEEETDLEVQEPEQEVEPVVEVTEQTGAVENDEEEASVPDDDFQETSPQEIQSKPEAQGETQEVEVDPADAQGALTVEQEKALAFYSKVSAPFKADGKSMTIRTPEDAIRLMQQGVNYSRRMEEIKPMKQLNEMLKQHGVADEKTLSFLIDLKNGKKEAIQQLLKDNQIDALDLTDEPETAYQTPNYSADPKDIQFKEAVEQTMQAEGGHGLIQEINSVWDAESKEALRDQPALFNDLLDQRGSGIYEKINQEISYQKSMGFLVGVPYLQAYHKVGMALTEAGAFNDLATTAQSQAPVPQPRAPIDNGPRKAVPAKNVQPNPNLSSTPVRAAPGNSSASSTLDYANLSDEEFLKAPPPV